MRRVRRNVSAAACSTSRRNEFRRDKAAEEVAGRRLLLLPPLPPLDDATLRRNGRLSRFPSSATASAERDDIAAASTLAGCICIRKWGKFRWFRWGKMERRGVGPADSMVSTLKLEFPLRASFLLVWWLLDRVVRSMGPSVRPTTSRDNARIFFLLFTSIETIY